MYRRYAGRIPVLVERAERSSPDLPDLGSNSKFLVPDTLTIGQLVYVIRQRLTLPPEVALFVYALDEAGKMTSLPSSALLREVRAYVSRPPPPSRPPSHAHTHLPPPRWMRGTPTPIVSCTSSTRARCPSAEAPRRAREGESRHLIALSRCPSRAPRARKVPRQDVVRLPHVRPRRRCEAHPRPPARAQRRGEVQGHDQDGHHLVAHKHG